MRFFSISRILVLVAAFGVPVRLAQAQAPENSSSPPVGEADQVEADREFSLGVQCHEAWDYSCALEHYRLSWKLKQKPYTAGNLAGVERHLELWTSAAEHYSFALRADNAPATRARLLGFLKDVKSHVAEVPVSVSRQGAQVVVDGSLVGTSPLPGPVFLNPGSHVIETTLGAVTQRQEITTTAGQVLPISFDLGREVTLASGPPPARSPEVELTQPLQPLPPPEVRKNWVPPVVAGSVGLVGVALGTGFLIASASSSRDRYDTQAPQTGSPCGTGTHVNYYCSGLSSDARKANTYTGLAVGAYLVGALGIGATIFLWPRKTHDAKQVAVDVSGTGISVHGAF